MIVLAYKGAPFIAACLEALERSTGVTFETIVVDNASADGSAADGTVLEEVRAGFLWDDQVLRTADVVVSKRAIGKGERA